MGRMAGFNSGLFEQMLGLTEEEEEAQAKLVMQACFYGMR